MGSQTRQERLLIESYTLYEETNDLEACRARFPEVFAELVALIQLQQFLCDVRLPHPSLEAMAAARRQLVEEAMAGEDGL